VSYIRSIKSPLDHRKALWKAAKLTKFVKHWKYFWPACFRHCWGRRLRLHTKQKSAQEAPVQGHCAACWQSRCRRWQSQRCRQSSPKNSGIFFLVGHLLWNRLSADRCCGIVSLSWKKLAPKFKKYRFGHQTLRQMTFIKLWLNIGFCSPIFLMKMEKFKFNKVTKNFLSCISNVILSWI